MKCPQPVPVQLGSGERRQVFCAACGWRTPVVADRRTAMQAFDAHPVVRITSMPVGADQ